MVVQLVLCLQHLPFFHVSVELFFLPSFALKTSPVPSTVLLLHPLETRAIKKNISQGLGSHFLPW